MYTGVSHSMHVEGRGQLTKIGSFLPPQGPGDQTWIVIPQSMRTSVPSPQSLTPHKKICLVLWICATSHQVGTVYRQAESQCSLTSQCRQSGLWETDCLKNKAESNRGKHLMWIPGLHSHTHTHTQTCTCSTWMYMHKNTLAYILWHTYKKMFIRKWCQWSQQVKQLLPNLTA